MASIVSAGTTSATALNMSADTTGILQLASNNGTVGLTMDTSQNVGVGTTSPSSYAKLVSLGADNATTFAAVGATNMLRVQGYNSTYLGTVLEAVNLAQSANTPLFINGSTLKFGISGTTQATIDSSGNLLVGTTTVNYSASGFTLSKDSGTTKWLCGPNAGNPTQFIISAATSLGVYLTSTSATSWSSASDERLKDIIEPIADGIEKVCTLRSVIGTYKNDPEKNRRPFLIAQDLQKVFPEAVDASDPDRLGVQYTEVIPLLVAAIKEQQALITQLQADVAALKGAA